jgi:hypothetical protein
MQRFHLFLDPGLIKKLKSESKNWGYSTVSAFVRYIIVRFFKENKN